MFKTIMVKSIGMIYSKIIFKWELRTGNFQEVRFYLTKWKLLCLLANKEAREVFDSP